MQIHDPDFAKAAVQFYHFLVIALLREACPSQRQYTCQHYRVPAGAAPSVPLPSSAAVAADVPHVTPSAVLRGLPEFVVDDAAGFFFHVVTRFPRKVGECSALSRSLPRSSFQGAVHG